MTYQAINLGTDFHTNMKSPYSDTKAGFLTKFQSKKAPRAFFDTAKTMFFLLAYFG